MQPIQIPTLVDEPGYVLMWSMDEFIILSTFFGIGVMIAQKFFMIVIGVVMVKLYRRLKDSKQEGYILHLSYWYGLLPIKGYSIVNPFARKFLS